MAAFVQDDVAERILIRLNVNDLMRCKRVCKSWHSFITSTRFVNRHLKHSYNKDLHSNEFGHRRMVLKDAFPRSGFINHHLVGSSNGLVCVISVFSCNLIVCNPLTRELRQLELPPWISLSSCRGFGYDSSSDDYKVIIAGLKGENQTCVVQVLSLKSNVWRVIGEVKFACISNVGILCNGALYWIVTDENEKKLIISYDLSKDEFKEIPQPDDAGYELTYSSQLWTTKERLCLYRYRNSRYHYSCVDIWLMNDYNSWELLQHDRTMKYDIVHHLKMHMDYIPPESFFHHEESRFSKASLYIDNPVYILGAPIFVQSLVSPHVNGRSKMASNNKTSV